MTKVVYIDLERPRCCGIELDKPRNICGVPLPPTDWEGIPLRRGGGGKRRRRVFARLILQLFRELYDPAIQRVRQWKHRPENGLVAL